jgi:hypothetical protein
VIAWASTRSDVKAVRETVGQAGQPTSRARLTLAPTIAPRRDEILARLRAEPPRIELLPVGENGFYLAPEILAPGEEAVVTRRLGEVLEGYARDAR